VTVHQPPCLSRPALVSVLQVPRLVLAACSELMPTRTAAGMVSQYIAASLVAYAAADLQPLAAGTKHSSSSTAPSNSLVSSSSKATAMLWEQIKQSGILQQLPDALDIDPHVLHSRIAGLPSVPGLNLSQWASSLLRLLHGLQQIQPSFFTTHAVGQRCLAPGHAACLEQPAVPQHSFGTKWAARLDGGLVGGLLAGGK
jgi:hypothetical protein